nr:ribonuclease H-like domain-containing protein [Tanacetum cinerariifolium]
MRPLLRSSGPRPHGNSMRPPFRPAGHRPHGPRRPTMNGARPYKTFFQTPSFETRPFLKSSAVNNSYRAPWVPTVNRYVPPVNRKFSTGRRNFPTAHRKFPTASNKYTTGSTKNHTTNMRRKEKAVKPSACWTWNPSQELSNKGSSQNNIDDKGYWNSGCSRHMTGNISYLSNFEPFDGGYVSFGQGGCKITGKGTIKIGKQHKASCKSKSVNSVTKPIHTLHMDLFGPTSVSSISHKWVLVNKSQNKTPYELLNGGAPAIGFLKPFGCHVMILNTLDNLGKFEAKGDEGYFIGYSMSSKAFRVFNKRTRRVEENLHVEVLENKAIEQGAGPNWLFDIDSLTKSMNYVPVDA